MNKNSIGNLGEQKTNKPLVSIVVPCYNIEQYVKKCVDSILKQSYRQIEILLVDDGSTDGTSEILDDFRDKRIKVLHQNNGGLSAARNAGLTFANGKYICFIDGDDYIDDKYVEVMMSRAETENADVVVCGYNNVDMGGKILREESFSEDKILSGREAASDLLRYNRTVNISAWNKLYRTELFKKNNIGYPLGKLYEDSYTTYKLLFYSDKVCYVKNRLYYYVYRKESIMNSTKLEIRFNNIVNIINETKEFYSRMNCYEKYEKDLKTFEINWLSFILREAIKRRFYCDARIEALNRLKSMKNDIRKGSNISKTAKVLLPFLNIVPAAKKERKSI